MNGQTVRLATQQQRQLAHRLIDRAPPNAIVNVQEEARSPDQNALMWCLLSDIARAKPGGRVLPTEQWKCLFMAAIGQQPIFQPTLDGTSVVCVGFKSSRLRKAEMSDLIESIYAFGAEHSVVWSTPAERKAA